MNKGIHTIRTVLKGVTGFSPATPQRFTLDNGNFLKNMKVIDWQFFPVGTTATYERIDNLPIFMQMGTTEAGAAITNVPTDAMLDVTDNRAIAFGSFESESGLMLNFVDPDHVIIRDLWLSAATVTAAGTVQVPEQDIGVIIKLQQVKSTEAESIVQLIKENSQRHT